MLLENMQGQDGLTGVCVAVGSRWPIQGAGQDDLSRVAVPLYCFVLCTKSGRDVASRVHTSTPAEEVRAK